MRGRVAPSPPKDTSSTPPPRPRHGNQWYKGGGSRPAPIEPVKCWKVAHLNAKTLLKKMPKIQKVATSPAAFLPV